MNKTVFGITFLICANTLSEFMMINGNTMNTKAHNNDLLLIIKHCQYFVHPSSTTRKKLNHVFQYHQHQKDFLVSVSKQFYKDQPLAIIEDGKFTFCAPLFPYFGIIGIS